MASTSFMEAVLQGPTLSEVPLVWNICSKELLNAVLLDGVGVVGDGIKEVNDDWLLWGWVVEAG